VVFGKIVSRLGIKKADFLVVNNDWGRGTADEFSKILKDNGIAVGLVERMDQGAQDMSAQLVKLKGSGADTLFVTTAVEQLSLVLKQAASLGLNLRIISTGGSQNPDQLITNVGKAADGTWHLVFFAPWAPEATPDPAAAKTFVAEWNSRGLPFGGLTSSFRGYDGIRAITEAVKIAGKAEPEADSCRAVEGGYSRPQRPDQIRKGRPERARKRPEHAERLSGEDRQRPGYRSENLERPI
jgi:branched-chain amino acid transport system substrate-binding protein